MKSSFYQTPRSSRIMRWFWKAAGGDRYLLEKATYADQVKYMCLGGVVVATGAMAALAGGYAFYTIFSPKTANVLEKVKTTTLTDSLAQNVGSLGERVAEVASSNVQQGDYIPTDIPTMLMSIVFGVIWGLIIFNIDRFIVTSTGKGDGTEKITKEELVGAIPRLIMGMIIAITISKPVEIRMFKSEIDVKLHEEQIKQVQKYKHEVDSVYNSEIAKKEATINQRLARIAQLDAISDELKGHIAYETGHGDCKSKCEEYKRQLLANEAQIASIKQDPEYVKVKADLDDLEIKRKEDLSKATQVASGLDGLLERIKMAHEVAGFTISLFITLLFMAIELTPIFFKLMLIKTPYDYMDDNVKELIKASNGIEIKYDYYTDKKGVDRHLVINHEVERLIHETKRLTDIQKELTDYALEKYKEREKEKIDKDLDKYVKNITSEGNAQPGEADDNNGPQTDNREEDNKPQNGSEDKIS